MRINSVEQLEQFRAIIGEVNFAGANEAIRDGQDVRIYVSREEIEGDKFITFGECVTALAEFAKTGNKFAGLILQKPEEPHVRIPGINATGESYGGGYTDSHGNEHGGWHSDGPRH